MKKSWMLLLAIVVVICCSQATMALMYQGTISVPQGIYASEPWSRDIALSWTITQMGNYWNYHYEFSYGQNDISHIIIEVSDGATLHDFWGTQGMEVRTFSPSEPSNPGMPGSLYGLKIDTDLNGSAYVFDFNSFKNPVWGDFYAKDGVYGTPGNKLPVYAYNSSYGTADPLDAPANGSINNKILRPDTYTTPIPEPSSLILVGSALILLTGVRRFFR